MRRVFIMDDCDELIPGWLKFLLGVIQCFWIDAVTRLASHLWTSRFHCFNLAFLTVFFFGTVACQGDISPWVLRPCLPRLFCCVRQPALHSHSFSVLFCSDLATSRPTGLCPKETQRSLQKFLEPEKKPKVIYVESSLEFGKACEDLSWTHCTSTPHRSETNGIAARAVRRVKEGTSAVLLQSGLNENWWADSMECYTYLRNVTDLFSDAKTLYERRFGQPFKGPIIPVGSLVEYHPITAKDHSKIPSIWKESLTWIVPRIRSVRGGDFGRVT